MQQSLAATPAETAKEETKAAGFFGIKTAASKDKDIIVDTFAKFRSCGIEELKLKALSKQGEHKDLSVFIASKAQIAQAAKKKEQMMRAVMAQ